MGCFACLGERSCERDNQRMGSQGSTPACRAGATTVGAIQGLQLQPWKRDPDLGLFLCYEILSLPAAWCFWKPLQRCFSHLGYHCSPSCSQEHRSALVTAPCSARWPLGRLLPARRAHLFAPVVLRQSGISC